MRPHTLCHSPSPAPRPWLRPRLLPEFWLGLEVWGSPARHRTPTRVPGLRRWTCHRPVIGPEPPGKARPLSVWGRTGQPAPALGLSSGPSGHPPLRVCEGGCVVGFSFLGPSLGSPVAHRVVQGVGPPCHGVGPPRRDRTASPWPWDSRARPTPLGRTSAPSLGAALLDPLRPPGAGAGGAGGGSGTLAPSPRPPALPLGARPARHPGACLPRLELDAGPGAGERVNGAGRGGGE